VQDFYPTPGTISTVMYYTGIHPMTNKRVAVTTDYREKQLQRALLQYSKPENANLVREALTKAGREDLIGNGPDCLVREAFGRGQRSRYTPEDERLGKRPTAGHSQGGTGKRGAPGKKNANNSLHGSSKGKQGANNNLRKGGTTAKKGSKAGEKAAKFYQPFVDAKKPKKTKLERVFGDEATKIRLEADRMIKGKPHGKNAKKSR
jgi:hypothetical protein